jgi:hypothetical protein
MDFLTPELLRILKPGRVACVHVKDRIRFASVTGLARPTVEPFHCRDDRAFPAPRLRLHGPALHRDRRRAREQPDLSADLQGAEEGQHKMGSGSPEFLLLFFKLPTDRANGYADEPVTKDAAEYSLARWQIDADACGARRRPAADGRGSGADAGRTRLARMLPAWSHPGCLRP